MEQLEEKHLVVARVPLEYKRDVEATMSRLRKVHSKELDSIAIQVAREQSKILTEYESLSKDIMCFRTNMASQNRAKAYPSRRQYLQECLNRVKAKVASN